VRKLCSEDNRERIIREQEYVKRFENNNVAQQMLEIYKEYSR
jgi:hypothetical protein